MIKDILGIGAIVTAVVVLAVLMAACAQIPSAPGASSVGIMDGPTTGQARRDMHGY